jgi:hypothetical protein
MNDLETGVRRVLAEAAEKVPADAVERITGADYRPRAAWFTPWRTAGTLVGLGVTGAGVASAVLLTATAPAFAGWTATPQRGHLAPSAAADSSCQSRLSVLPTAPSGEWTRHRLCDLMLREGSWTSAAHTSGRRWRLRRRDLARSPERTMAVWTRCHDHGIGARDRRRRSRAPRRVCLCRH